MLVAQLITSYRWKIGFLDFTQAFHSGDAITRTIYATQPREGVPGMKPGQLIKLEKVCYGLVDGPYAWYQHLRKFITTELGYQQSLADPCIFYVCRRRGDQQHLGGIIAVATDDLLHGGDEEHLRSMEKIKAKYKLGKFQFEHAEVSNCLWSLALAHEASVTTPIRRNCGGIGISRIPLRTFFLAS